MIFQFQKTKKGQTDLCIRKKLEKLDPQLETKNSFSKKLLRQVLAEDGIQIRRIRDLGEAIDNLTENDDEIQWNKFQEFLKQGFSILFGNCDIIYLDSRASSFIHKAMRSRLAISNWSHFIERIQKIYETTIQEIEEECKRTGVVIDKTCAISMCTVDGQTFSLGDYKQVYPIDACVKPLLYSLLLEDIGYENVNPWNFFGCKSIIIFCRFISGLVWNQVGKCTMILD